MLSSHNKKQRYGKFLQSGTSHVAHKLAHFTWAVPVNFGWNNWSYRAHSYILNEIVILSNMYEGGQLAR